MPHKQSESLIRRCGHRSPRYTSKRAPTQERFTSAAEAKKKQAKLWCCSVLYEQRNGTELIELASAGVGFSHGNIRSFAVKNIQSKARDADARRGAAAAAEARFAQTAAKQPKKSAPAGGVTYNTNDGKPDISNPVVWD